MRSIQTIVSYVLSIQVWLNYVVLLNVWIYLFHLDWDLVIIFMEIKSNLKTNENTSSQAHMKAWSKPIFPRNWVDLYKWSTDQNGMLNGISHTFIFTMLVIWQQSCVTLHCTEFALSAHRRWCIFLSAVYILHIFRLDLPLPDKQAHGKYYDTVVLHWYLPWAPVSRNRRYFISEFIRICKIKYCLVPFFTSTVH